ncbi:hypothetical protein [Pseudodesulfovibrio senegalensis]|jgi:hypothetical protein|uniref:Uncharacterized protein n=1 Tax=Pseudodesulfovibrio senegalensis TaxID=1721087 RepID=A0A6N6N0H3_9BACT|nr:hypothetical protein [Pseudodesulfovibrio senegalensis]KAB1438960.1 hypothetical protein F8A88_14655 [Pseudodesulfovibrio senegalensis]
MSASETALRFEILKIAGGWLDMRLHVDGTSYDLTVSSVFSEPLRDLCDCLYDAVTGDTGNWANGDMPHFVFEWLGEGWLYEWKVSALAEDRIRLEVGFSGNRVKGEAKYPVWNISCEVPAQHVADQVWSQCRETIRTMGFTQYRSQWGSDFPLAQLLALRAAHSGQGKGAPVAEELDLLRELMDG